MESTLIAEITSFGGRQFENEIDCAKYIRTYLDGCQVKYLIQSFNVEVPYVLENTLLADGRLVECLASTFSSGGLSDKAGILSSHVSYELTRSIPNINFNPFCSAISRTNFYDAPALAIARSDVVKIIRAQTVEGSVKVEKRRHTSMNILCGNTSNPQNIVFTHYDSLGTGACDNASGVAVVLEIIRRFPQLLDTTLFAICGAEELSYDKDIYWGAGYRRFESKYSNLMNIAKHIFVIDSVGNGKTEIYRDLETQLLAVPLTNMTTYQSKIAVVAGDLHALMNVYHSDADVASKLRVRFLSEARETLLIQLKQ